MAFLILREQLILRDTVHVLRQRLVYRRVHIIGRLVPATLVGVIVRRLADTVRRGAYKCVFVTQLGCKLAEANAGILVVVAEILNRVLITEIVGGFVCSVIAESFVIHCIAFRLCGSLCGGCFLLALRCGRCCGVAWIIGADAVFVLVGGVTVVVVVLAGGAVPVAAGGVGVAGVGRGERRQQGQERQDGDDLLSVHIANPLNFW